MPTLTARSASVQMHPAAVSVVGLQLYHFESLFERRCVDHWIAISLSIRRPPSEEYDFLKYRRYR